jgi:hypothetical protein
MKLGTRDTESADFKHVKVTKERDFDQRREEQLKTKEGQVRTAVREEILLTRRRRMMKDYDQPSL